MIQFLHFDDGIAGKPVRMFNREGKFADYSIEEIVKNKMNRFKGWHCSAGLTSLHVDFNGNIFPASDSCQYWRNYYLKDNSKISRLGNIYQGRISLPSEWLICHEEACECGGDIFIPKVSYQELVPVMKRVLNKDYDPDRGRPDDLNFEMATRVFCLNGKQILVDLHKKCNYDCIYCGQHDRSSPFRSFGDLKKAALLLKDQFLNGQPGHLSISGGEPTLNPALPDWIQFLYEEGIKVATHSNGTKSPEFYQNIIQYADLNISLHFEYFKKDHIIEVVTAVVRKIKERHEANQSHGFFELKVMMIPGTLEEVLYLKAQLQSIPDVSKYSSLIIAPLHGRFARKEFHDNGNFFDMDYLPKLDAPFKEIQPFYEEEEIVVFGTGYE